MYIASGLLFFSFGFTMLKFISCYSDGSLLEDQCHVANINHNLLPQTNEAPFEVDWTPEGNETSKVTLSATSVQFRGFMLDFRNCDGTLSLVAQDNNRLICGDRVMVQSNNLRKTSVSGLWTPKSAGQCLFRAVFLKDFPTFWEKKFTFPSTTPPPTDSPTYSHSPTTANGSVKQNSNKQSTSEAPPTSEATSTQTNPTAIPTKFTTTSNVHRQATGTPTAPLTLETNSTQTNPTTSPTKCTTTSKINSQDAVRPPSPPPQCVQYLRCILALLLFSRLCFLGGSSLLIIIRPDLKKMAILNASVLELASKTVAVILVLIKTIKYECVYKCAGLRIVFTALTVAAMVSSLLHTITVFLRCGPSHELRKYWFYAIIMVDLMNTVITTTAIFFGTCCFEERWLPILMGVYVVWEIMLYLGSVCFEQMEKHQIRKKVRNQSHILEKRISPWLFMFMIFTVFNIMLTAALMTGVSLVRMMN